MPTDTLRHLYQLDPAESRPRAGLPDVDSFQSRSLIPSTKPKTARPRKPFRSPLYAPLDAQETNVGSGVVVPRVSPGERAALRRQAKIEYERRRAAIKKALNTTPHTAPEECYRHAAYAGRREQSYNGLVASGAGMNRLQRFSCCGSEAVVQIDPATQNLRVRSNHCHDRWCPACGAGRSQTIKKNLMRWLETREVRFVTLTVKHVPAPLHTQVDRLITCFRNLRARPFWKLRVDGGASFLEIKVAKDGRLWHPHFHVLIEGRYLPEKQLQDEWYAVTGDSFMADVRQVEDKERTASYVAKYASKPLDPSIFNDPEKLVEAMKALRGRRLATTIGTWRGLLLAEKEIDDAEWITIAPLNTLVLRAAAGSLADQALLKRLFEHKPLVPIKDST